MRTKCAICGCIKDITYEYKRKSAALCFTFELYFCDACGDTVRDHVLELAEKS